MAVAGRSRSNVTGVAACAEINASSAARISLTATRAISTSFARFPNA
jgi:hypothetical protein